MAAPDCHVCEQTVRPSPLFAIWRVCGSLCVVLWPAACPCYKSSDETSRLGRSQREQAEFHHRNREELVTFWAQRAMEADMLQTTTAGNPQTLNLTPKP